MIKEKVMGGVFFIAAMASILAVLLICIFLFANGIPAMAEIGVFDFLLGREWAPTDNPAAYGIFPMIMGSLYITAGAILIGVPVGILTAVFMAYYCPRSLYRVLQPLRSYWRAFPPLYTAFLAWWCWFPLSG